eukprot:1159141-Pelagomonas_calceolata.AAC.3
MKLSIAEDFPVPLPGSRTMKGKISRDVLRKRRHIGPKSPLHHKVKELPWGSGTTLPEGFSYESQTRHLMSNWPSLQKKRKNTQEVNQLPKIPGAEAPGTPSTKKREMKEHVWSKLIRVLEKKKYRASKQPYLAL